MKEVIIDLGDIDLKMFYGEDNKHVAALQKQFPSLRIVFRGNKAKAYGSGEALSVFEKGMKKLVHLAERKDFMDMEDFENMLAPEADTDTAANADVLLYQVSGKPIRLQNKNQRRFIELVEQNDMVFTIGPAGTGKTYISVALAVKALKNKQVKRIILTRPAVEAGENLGFLPGDIKEKLDPYMQPLYDALLDMIPRQKLEFYLQERIIEIAPLAFMRGRTLDDAFVILDEAQNTTFLQMKMFLTRMGRTAKFIITGDPGQGDLPFKTHSGLHEAVKRLQGIEGIAFLHLDEADVVRHPLVRRIIKAFSGEP